MVRAGLERLMVRRPPAAVGRLGGLIAGLCLFAALRVTHAAFAPGDMSWLSAPLIVATAVLLLALAHGLLWTFHALEQDLHDRETKALQAAGIPSPRQTSRGASEA
jgi:hypothetical protein